MGPGEAPAWGRNGASWALQTSGPRHPGALLAHRPSPPPSPKLHLGPPQPPLPTPPPTPHGGSCSAFCLLCPSLISVMGFLLSGLPGRSAHTHTHFTDLHVLTPTLTSPHTFTYTQKHTPAHTLSQGSHAHTCAHIPVCPDTHTQLYFLTHSYTHIHTRLRLAPRTSLLRALLCPGHGLP